MEHLAIDLGGGESQICVRNSDCQIVEERRCRTVALGAYLAGRPRSRVVMESCSEAFGVADAAWLAGHEVRVVPATLVRSLGVGAGRLKTDGRDAQVLSEVSCRIDLPSVHVPSPQARQRKTLWDARSVGRRPDESIEHGTWLAAGRRPPTTARRRCRHVHHTRPSSLR
jgi:hypothetical protein